MQVSRFSASLLLTLFRHQEALELQRRGWTDRQADHERRPWIVFFSVEPEPSLTLAPTLEPGFCERNLSTHQAIWDHRTHLPASAGRPQTDTRFPLTGGTPPPEL
ncbi:hypothetical protein CRENBAI_005760 [Crenichthys baileyi]|uniref:Uncharacterized protein n=1 Tax=Crenichthys baileyi TaxID=28760 RepID=A0AAV9QSK3_9TELE